MGGIVQKGWKIKDAQFLKNGGIHRAQIREHMLVPDLYVFTLKFKITQQSIRMD